MYHLKYLYTLASYLFLLIFLYGKLKWVWKLLHHNYLLMQ